MSGDFSISVRSSSGVKMRSLAQSVSGIIFTFFTGLTEA